MEPPCRRGCLKWIEQPKLLLRTKVLPLLLDQSMSNERGVFYVCKKNIFKVVEEIRKYLPMYQRMQYEMEGTDDR